MRKNKKNILKASIVFITISILLLSGIAMGANFDFREKEKIDSDSIGPQMIAVDHDVGVTSIISPVSGFADVITPEVVVENFGLNDETSVPVNMEISRFEFSNWVVEYDKTVTVDIDSMENMFVTFPDWTPEGLCGGIEDSITYKVTGCSQLINDDNSDNDCLVEIITLDILTPITFILNITVSGCGWVELFPPGGMYSPGTVVYLTAYSCESWVFDYWGGDIYDPNFWTYILMDSDKSITAHFWYVLPIEIIGSGNVTKTPDEIAYPVGDDVELTAIPDEGWEFAGWTRDINSSDNPVNLMTQSSMYGGVTANFIECGNTPEISDVVLTASEPLDTKPGFGWENVSATVTDIFGIGEVKLVATWPDDAVVEYPMTNIPDTDTYYVNTTFTDDGCYNYYVWADDIYNSENTSSLMQFELPPNEDVDMNGCVHFMDLVGIALRYGECGPPGWIREDVDNNGCVHFMDLVAVVLRYGECWEQC